MTKQEIFEFINANPVFFLATMENNQPHTRAMMMIEADENGILFNTGRVKEVCKQLTSNPSVELCFFNKDFTQQIRVTGKAAETHDIEVKKKVLAKLPFLQPVVDEHGYEALASFYLRNAAASIWTREKAFEPKQYVQL